MPSGTPGYMAPEVLKIKGSSLPQNDIFSLGVILYMPLGSNHELFCLVPVRSFFCRLCCVYLQDRCPTVSFSTFHGCQVGLAGLRFSVRRFAYGQQPPFFRDGNSRTILK
eukprot:Skav208249  [mRNA]  locus=scaffold3005:30164:30493:- [translate_table: standard]